MKRSVDIQPSHMCRARVVKVSPIQVQVMMLVDVEVLFQGAPGWLRGSVPHGEVDPKNATCLLGAYPKDGLA